MKLLFYSSASYQIAPEYNAAAREVVRAVAALGYDIVSGATVKGTMRVVCEEARKAGARVIGFVPRFMKEYAYPDLDELVWTDSMSERKERMREGTEAVIALPGGIGTLDELFETYTLAKLGKYSGKVIVYNYSGFYEPLKALLDDMVEKKVLDAHTRGLIAFPQTVEELISILRTCKS